MTSLVDRFVQKYNRWPTEFDKDYLEMLNMSKYRILAVPDVSLAQCANCGSSKNDGRKYVDFDLQIDFHGVVFLCGLCVNDIAKALGSYDKYNERIKELENKIELQETLTVGSIELFERFKATFEEVKDYLVNLPVATNYTDSDRASSVEPTEPVVESPNPKPAKANPRAVKSTPGSGSKDVRSLASLLEDNS